MGKFERGEAEKLEKGLAYKLNGKQSPYNHKCLNILYKKIISDISNIKGALFIGRQYTEPGDIKIFTNHGTVYIELKLVKSGKGTRANVSQDAITELGLLYDPNGETLSWSKFRRINRFDEKVNNLLNLFPYYPPGIKTKEEKAKYLRDQYIKPAHGSPIEKKARLLLKSTLDPRTKLAAEIVIKIVELARQDKLSYINYLKKLRQNNEAIKKFSILLLLGFHKYNTIKMGMTYFNKIINSLQKGNYIYRTYYIIKNKCYIYVEELSCLINKLLQAQFKILFPKDETNILISYSDNYKYNPILRVVFHWKNVFQGIKTPCLNIFDEGILKGYVSCYHIS